MPTINDIARIVGVSKSTVSRALNDSPLIGEETRRRVRAVAEELQFSINVSAQRLSRQSSRTIAFVTHCYDADCTLSDLFSLEIMGGISRGLHNAGYDMLVVEIDPRDTGWARKLLDSAQVDGFVLMTSTRKQAHIKLLSELQAPFVAWGVPGVEAGFCTVSSDNRRGGELAGRHLVGLGRRRFALIAGPEIEAEVQLRLSGCANALAAAGLSLDDGLVRWGDFSEESGRQAMESLLDLDPRPDAVFAFGDFMAIGAMKAIRGRGLRIPEDVAVVGFDNLMVAAYVEPPLTTVSQNVARSGKALAESLVQYLRTGQISHVIMPVDLVRRGSA